MMLTEDTAKRLRVRDRLDARQSIGAGARYLADLKRSLPARIAEPDRTWIALAAFNIGTGHLEDARVLAVRRKLNPDSWSDIKKTLPQLAQTELAEQRERFLDIAPRIRDRKSTRLNSSHVSISYAVFCLKKKNIQNNN